MDTAEEAYQEACLRALQKLAAERAAARSHRLADPGRAQCGAGRRAQGAAHGRTAARRVHLRPGRCGNAAGRAAGRLALPRRCAEAAVHLLPSRTAGDAADRAGAAHRLGPYGGADRARLPGERCGDGAAHHPRQGARSQEPMCRSRRQVRRSGRAAGCRRGHDLSGVQRRLFRRRRPSARRCATRRSGWRACCCGCSRPSRRSWV